VCEPATNRVHSSSRIVTGSTPNPRYPGSDRLKGFLWLITGWSRLLRAFASLALRPLAFLTQSPLLTADW
jgi:hypothetical protein